MTLHVSQKTEVQLMQEAQREGVSVDALVERLISERTAIAPPSGMEAQTPTVFEHGLGLFSSVEDAALIDSVVLLAYAERRRGAKEQPLGL